MVYDIKHMVQEAGTPTALAEMLGFSRRAGGQRVSQWLARGAIPEYAERAHKQTFERLDARRKARERRARKRASRQDAQQTQAQQQYAEAVV